MDLEGRLAELRGLVERARAIPMSSSCVVDRAEVLATLAEIEKLLPERMAAADEVLAERAVQVDQGRQQAARLVGQAKAEQQRLVSLTEVQQEARHGADRILQEARAEAAALRKEADDYVDHKLATFEIALSKTLAAVSRGRARLQARSELTAFVDDDDASAPLPGG